MPQAFDKPRIELAHRLVANALDLGSAILCMIPEALDVTTNHAVPSATRVRWRHLAIPAETMDDQWVTYDGVTGARWLPRNYPLAAILLIDREIMDRHRERYHGHPAVTYQLGSTVMMGSSNRHEILGLAHKDAEDYTVAMGIGPGPLMTGAGVYFRGGTALYTSLVYMGFKHGVRRGPTVPVNEIPLTTPYLQT